MTHSEIERWALRVIEQVKNGQPNEDARVELKAMWPESSYKAARQIAAHANPAGGEPVLWIIGVDQKTGVIGAEHNELASWYSQVRSHFEDIAPELTDVNISVDGMTVVALLFNTERRLFVVKTQGGSVTSEVPWREGTLTRSAKRTELLRILDRIPRLPKWEAINGTLDEEQNTQPRMRGNNLLWQLALKLYVVLEGPDRLSIPFHRCSGTLEFPAFGTKTRLRSFRLSPYDRQSVSIKGSNTDLVIDGSGMVRLEASAESIYGGVIPHTEGYVSIDLPTANSQYTVPVQVVFSFNDGTRRWEFGDLSEESPGIHV